LSSGEGPKVQQKPAKKYYIYCYYLPESLWARPAGPILQLRQPRTLVSPMGPACHSSVEFPLSPRNPHSSASGHTYLLSGTGSLGLGSTNRGLTECLEEEAAISQPVPDSEIKPAHSNGCALAFDQAPGTGSVTAIIPLLTGIS
jgi:hypothetical protein